jgi:hypothetical protein
MGPQRGQRLDRAHALHRRRAVGAIERGAPPLPLRILTVATGTSPSTLRLPEGRGGQRSLGGWSSGRGKLGDRRTCFRRPADRIDESASSRCPQRAILSCEVSCSMGRVHMSGTRPVEPPEAQHDPCSTRLREPVRVCLRDKVAAAHRDRPSMCSPTPPASTGSTGGLCRPANECTSGQDDGPPGQTRFGYRPASVRSSARSVHPIADPLAGAARRDRPKAGAERGTAPYGVRAA